MTQMAEQKSSLTIKLERESQRSTSKEWHEIYLYKEGTFFHAFNQSAWLLSQFVYKEDYRKQIGEKKPLQVNRTKVQNGGDYLIAGFPCRSLDKYIGACDQEETVVDGDVVTVTMPPFLLAEQETEVYQKQYEDFAVSIPVKESKPKKGSSPEVIALGQDMKGKSGMFEIIKQIMAFPIEESNPMDAMNFSVRIKKMVGDLL